MRTPWPVVAALTLLAPLALHAPSQAQSTAPAVPYARVVVKFKADAPVLRARALSASGASERALALGPRVGVALSGGAMASERAQVFTASGISSAELASRLAAQPDVEYAEPDVRHRRTAAPNDPRYGSVAGNGPTSGQWYLKPPSSTLVSAINAETAWDATTGSSAVVVAVLDTGVRFDHPDLLAVGSGGNLLSGYDMVSQDRVNVFATAGDGNGRDSDPSDPGDFVSAADLASGNFDNCFEENSSWHGTQTASLVGAITNNGIGMASVGRTVRVLPVRVLGKCGGYTSDIAAGIRWAAGITVDGLTNPTPANVINMSLGGTGACSQTYQDAINEAVTRGVLVVVSAGNSDGHAVSSPANCSGVLAVTALRHAGTKVGFADVGPEVAIAAPGGNCINPVGQPCLYPIITATNSGTTTPVTNSSAYTDSINSAYGTSFSAPLVAGTAGLLLSVRPGMSVSELRTTLQGSARAFPTNGTGPGTPICQAPTGASQGECYCTTGTCGAGMLNAHGAVLGAQAGLQARITSSLVLPRAAQALTLSAASSYVLSGRTLASYQWTLVDGGGIVTALPNPTDHAITVTPTASGWFTVRVTVTDTSSATSTSEQAVYVGAPVVAPVTSDGGGGGGALGLFWLAGLALAVWTLQLQRKRTLVARAHAASRRPQP